MDKAAALDRWDHTACIKTIIANVNRGPKQRQFSEFYFNPMRNKNGGIKTETNGAPTKESIDELREKVRACGGKARQYKAGTGVC